MRRSSASDRFPSGDGTSHYARGQPGDPTGAVTNEDYAGALVVFANGAGARSSAPGRSSGRRARWRSTSIGTKGAIGWNLEQLNELQVYLVDDDGLAPRGYTTVYGGDRYPFHGHFVPGDANSIGFEDVVTIEDYAFLTSVGQGRAVPAGPGGGGRLRQLPGGVAAFVRVGPLGGCGATRAEGGDSMKTIRLTTAQAIVRYLTAQRTVIDGGRSRCSPACSRSSGTAT